VTTKRRRKNRLPPFIAVIKGTMAMPAWRAMSTGARLYYIELRGRLRNDYANNGKVFLSCRDGAKAIGARPGTIQRWAAENEHYGFLRKTSEGFLGSDGRGIARIIGSPSSPAERNCRREILKNGMAGCSSIRPAGLAAKNRIP
jgi:hypothetical protein